MCAKRDLACVASDLTLEDIALLPLFTRMLTEAGTTNYDEVALVRKIGAETGGISATFHTEIR